MRCNDHIVCQSNSVRVFRSIFSGNSRSIKHNTHFIDTKLYCIMNCRIIILLLIGNSKLMIWRNLDVRIFYRFFLHAVQQLLLLLEKGVFVKKNKCLPVILRCRFSRIRGLFRKIRAPLELLALLQLLFVALSLQLVSQLGSDATVERSTEIDSENVDEKIL